MKIFRIGKSVVLTIVALLVLGNSFVPGYSFASETSNSTQNITRTEIESTMDDQALSENIRFWENLGLKHDVDYVQQIIENKQIHNNEFGVILTNEEVNNLKDRVVFQNKVVSLVREYFNNINKEELLGLLYVNQRNGGTIHIGLTAPIDQQSQIVADLKSIINNDQMVNFFEARYSESTLKQKHDEITNSLEELKALGITVTHIETNVFSQTVDVGINEYNPSNIKILENKFGKDIITVEKGSVANNTARNTYRRPMEGGLEIISEVQSKMCTGGFNAFYWDGSKTQYYYVTAGHCGDIPYDYFYQGGSLFGTYMTKKNNKGQSDGGAIYMGDIKDKVSNLIYRTDTSSREITSWQYASDDYVGQYSCYSGRTSNVKCGNLVSKDYSVWFGTTFFYDMRKTDYPPQGGDSGAPHYYNNEVYGVVKGYSTEDGVKYGVYSHVEYVLKDLGLGGVLTW